MDIMNKLFQAYLDQFAVVFIDDKLVYYKKESDHEEHVRIILRTLCEHQLYAKFSKCELWLKEVHFLSHVILAEGIKMDLTKVKAILECNLYRMFWRFVVSWDWLGTTGDL